MVLPELAGLSPQKLGAAPPSELDVVEAQITTVLTTIHDQLVELDGTNFPVAGHIAKGSFGGTSRAANLALHHTRAHAVTVDMLKDLRSDLKGFRDAIREARRDLTTADEAAETDLKLALGRTESIDMGATGYDQGKQEHADEQPTSGVPDGDEF